MNDIFNLTRFIGLFKKQTAENYKTYLMSTGVLVGILTLILSFVIYTSNGHISMFQQGIIFLNIMFFSGTIFSSMIFADLGNKKKAIPMLTLPVSHLEKYLVCWIYSFVFFQLLYLGCFYVVDYVLISISNSGLRYKNDIVNVFSVEDRFWIAFPQFAVLQSICFAGAIFFEKLHFIKTAFIFFIFILLLTLFNRLVLTWMFDVKIVKGVPFNLIGILENDKLWFIRGDHASNLILLGTVILLCIVLWAGTYFRLKEKQV